MAVQAPPAPVLRALGRLIEKGDPWKTERADSADFSPIALKRLSIIRTGEFALVARGDDLAGASDPGLQHVRRRRCPPQNHERHERRRHQHPLSDDRLSDRPHCAYAGPGLAQQPDRQSHAVPHRAVHDGGVDDLLWAGMEPRIPHCLSRHPRDRRRTRASDRHGDPVDLLRELTVTPYILCKRISGKRGQARQRDAYGLPSRYPLFLRPS